VGGIILILSQSQIFPAVMLQMLCTEAQIGKDATLKTL